jgi:hypothetical protein
MFFEHGTIYSYGYHFKIAQYVTNKDGQKCIFLNSRSYSNSTNKQQSLVFRSIPANVEFYKVVSFFDNIENSTKAHLDNLNSYLEYAKDSQQKTIKATKLKYGYINQIDINLDIFTKYSTFFGIDFENSRFADIYKDFELLAQWVDEYRHSEEFVQWEIEQDAKEKKSEAKALIDAKEKIEAFREFKISSIYANLGHYLLRYNKETDNIETSGGVKMSKDLFLSAYQRLINNELLRGQHVDRYTFNGVDGDIVSVGCHKIPMTEIKNIVAVL